MWSVLVPALVAITVAVVAQTVFFDPTSRRVRRLKAYLEVRALLEDSAHVADIDVLINREISTELASRTAGRRLVFSQVRLASWAAMSVAIAVCLGLAMIFLDDNLPLLLAVAALLFILSILNMVSLYRSRNEVWAQKAAMNETILADLYASDATSRGLYPELELSGGRFDLILRDGANKVVEVVVAKDHRDVEPEQLLAKRLWAQRLEPTAKFVLVTHVAPPAEFRLQLRRLGVSSFAHLSGGSFKRSI